MQENYEVKNEAAKAKLRDMGEYLKREMPAGWGFTFLMFEYGKDGALFYLSSAVRADMIETMKEFIVKQQTGGKRQVVT